MAAIRPPSKAPPKGKIVLVANAFPMTRGPSTNVFHYNVEISPAPPRPLVQKLFDDFVDSHKASLFKSICPAFDGVSLLITNKELLLPPGANELSFSLTTTAKKEFSVRIRKTATIKKSDFVGTPNELQVQTLEIIAREHVRKSFLQVRNKYISHSPPLALDSFLEARVGIVQHIRSLSRGVVLNIDRAIVPFIRSPSLLDAVPILLSLSRGRSLESHRCSDGERTLLTSILKGVRIGVTHLKGYTRKFPIKGFVGPPSDVTFSLEEGRDVSVAEYFKGKYYPLKYPNLPCVEVSRGASGSSYLPLEVCSIVPDQPFFKTLNEDQRTAFVNLATAKPYDRFAFIKGVAEQAGLTNNAVTRSYGMVFDKELVSCDGYVIPPPSIRYRAMTGSTTKNLDPREGSWNLKDVRCIRGIKIKKWAVAGNASAETLGAATFLADSLRKFGIEIPKEFSRIPSSLTTKQACADLFRKAKKLGAEFVLIFLPPKAPSIIYKMVKASFETAPIGEEKEKGIITQCIKAENIGKAKTPSFGANIAMKVNSKFLGVNGMLDPSSAQTIVIEQPTIIFGADITHPPPGDVDGCSIASVTSSLGSDLGPWVTSCRPQAPRTEVIDGLQGLVESHLRKFRESCKVAPKRVFYFRDGVGDQQIKQVLEQEIGALRSAFRALSETYAPEVTFILVQKRHSLRFHLKAGSDNPPPGTIVDSFGIPGGIDFYLISHKALKGTTRPTRYQVVLNESKFKIQDLQRMCYYLCYLQGRSSKSVSVVPCVYYAHLAAARARVHIVGGMALDGEKSARTLYPDVSKRMYYM